MTNVRALRKSSPQQVREQLEAMGPTFVKIGQFLALRPDLIPQAYCDELLHLTDNATEFPVAEVERIVCEDLGGRLEDHFEYLSPRPLASASIAQVHLARTRQGEQVAVKVQRPGVREAVTADLRRKRDITRMLAAVNAETFTTPDEFIAELTRWLDEELDTSIELGNLRRMHELVKGHQDVQRSPKPYPKLSGKRVITLEYLGGVSFSEILRLVRSGRASSIAELGFRREELAENLLFAVLTQIFRFQFFHADPHPGNILALDGNVIGFVDFGLTDVLSPAFQQGMSQYVDAVFNKDVDGMMKGLLDVLTASEQSDRERFRQGFLGVTEAWIRDQERGSAEGAEGAPLRDYMIGIVSVARQSGYSIPPALLSMYRSLLTAETVAVHLGGGSNLSTTGERFFRRLRFDQAMAQLEPTKLFAAGLDVFDLVRAAPGQIRRLLGDLTDDRFTLPVRVIASAGDRRGADLRAKLVTTAAISITIAILLATFGDRLLFGPVHASWVLWPLLAAVYVRLALIWRKLS